MTCWRRLRDWQRAGVWELIHFALLDWLARKNQIDWTRQYPIWTVLQTAHDRALSFVTRLTIDPSLDLDRTMMSATQPTRSGRRGRIAPRLAKPHEICGAVGQNRCGAPR
jgi:hypothetical protein